MSLLPTLRAKAALKNAFIGDALAMPVHWFYNPSDIYRAFPNGIEQFEDAPSFHPSSIMSLHSTQQGGRANKARNSQKEIVGEVILKGKRKYWGSANRHYHHNMKAGENTLNAHCANIVLKSALEGYSTDKFLAQYINFMCAETPQHPDTYAESYHRGFFANLEQGTPPEKCGAITHDTASIGGLVSVTPLAIVQASMGESIEDIQTLARRHLYLTHPDEALAKICDAYVELIYRLLHRKRDNPLTILEDIAMDSIKLNLPLLTSKKRSDMEIVGRKFSPACYITDAWPSVLYFAYRYGNDPKQALIANTNVGGDNVHRGFVLGAIMGLIEGAEITPWFDKLANAQTLTSTIDKLG
ncbi:ADP-ribosylglycohydrolase family protein [Alteromonas gracilis]|uniref:ADP-ribosylglycohydrolase family protein n=1 Tax=Alteromonas gracilis TaxID=1479524 RepID=UPI003734F77B